MTTYQLINSTYGLTKVFVCWALIFISLESNAQLIPPTRDRQQIPSSTDTTNSEQVKSDLPDSIILRRYDPRFPIEFTTVGDSSLDLNYLRFDAVEAYGPDHVYLNSAGQPAALNPVIGTRYNQVRQLKQEEHPAQRAHTAPFLDQNVPYSYTAYDQGGEINDGQIYVLFGRTFNNGWKLGLRYRRIYQGGDRNRYPQSRAQRISFGSTLAFQPDSSRHRTYAWFDLNNIGHDNSWGYDFATLDTIETPEEPFEAVALGNNVRTESKFSSYNLLHRVFLRKQADSLATGWAASLEGEFSKGFYRTYALTLDDTRFGPFGIDDRGLRYNLAQNTILGKANLEYFSSPASSAPIDFNFAAGLYSGRQTFTANYLESNRNQFLLGLQGRLQGTILERFELSAETDLPLGDRVGEGLLKGSLGWTYKEQFGIEAIALIERSATPWADEIVGTTGQVIFQSDLPIGTHTRLGGRLNYKPLSATVSAYLDVFSNPVVYRTFGEPGTANGEIAIPTLAGSMAFKYGPFHLKNKIVLRNPVTSADIRLPGYGGQHSLYSNFWLFKRAMNMMVGLDGIVRSPVRAYSYFPLTGVFNLEGDDSNLGWQYQVDAYLGIKVQSFKAFVRLDNIIVNSNITRPHTVQGYPVVRGSILGPVRGLLRLGVSFFLFN